MTAPQYGQPMTPPQGYPQPGVAPQWPSQQPQVPQQGYPQPYGAPQGFPQQYAQPQGYGYPAAPQGPPPQLVEGSLDAYYAQPSGGGGAALSFKTITAHAMVINRELKDSDVQHQTAPKDKGGAPLYYRDGKPKLVLKVPVNVNPQASAIEDGKAVWFCQGGARDDLTRAQAAVGSLGTPEPGAFIWVAKVGMRQLNGGGTANIWDIRYTRPGPEAQAYAQQYGIAYPDLSGAAPAQPVAVAQPPAAPAAPVVPSTPPAPVAQAPMAPPAPVAQAPMAPPAPVAPQAPAAPAAQLAPPPAPGAPGELPPDKAALLASLTAPAG